MERFNTAGVFSKDILVWEGDGNLLKLYCDLKKTAFNSRCIGQCLAILLTFKIDLVGLSSNIGLRSGECVQRL